MYSQYIDVVNLFWEFRCRICRVRLNKFGFFGLMWESILLTHVHTHKYTHTHRGEEPCPVDIRDMTTVFVT